MDDGVEDARDGESDAKKRAKGEEREILQKDLEGVDEEVETAYGRNIQSERQSREGHSERQLQHYYFSCFGFW